MSVLLDVSVRLGADGQDEGGGLIGTEGGRHNQIFTRLQHQKLPHLMCVHVFFSLGDRLLLLKKASGNLPLCALYWKPRKEQMSK